MKRFNALKKVNAKPMTRQEYNDFRGWKLPADEDGSDEGYLTEDVNSPPNTLDFDGYVSWTPKAMFDDQFYEADDWQVEVGECAAPQYPDHELTANEIKTLANGDCPIEEGDEFDFGSAIYLMQKGKNVMRKGWNGKGMYLFIIQGSNDIAKLHGYGFGELLGEPTFSDAIFLKTVDNRLVPWTISQSDALATDWCLA